MGSKKTCFFTSVGETRSQEIVIVVIDCILQHFSDIFIFLNTIKLNMHAQILTICLSKLSFRYLNVSSSSLSYVGSYLNFRKLRLKLFCVPFGTKVA